MSGRCSAEDNYQTSRVNSVLLQEYTCTPDNSLDLTTGECSSANCEASCQPPGDINAFSHDEAQDYVIKDVGPGYFEHQVTDESKAWINAGDFIGFTGDIAYR